MKRKWKIALAASGAALAVLLGTVGVLDAVRQSRAASLDDQQAAVRWSSTSAQLSRFFADGAGITAERIPQIEKSVEEALLAASLAPEEGGRLWYHAYSAETEAYAMTERGSASVAVTVYGGEYFLIHQPTLVSGSYPGSDGSYAGSVFLDEAAAWSLFGAVDVVGMGLTLGGAPYTVCGVGRAPEGTLFDEAYGERGRAYVLWSSAAASGMKTCTVYEAVLPNPVDGFAEGIAETLFPASDDVVAVENSERFSIPALWKHLRQREQMGTRTSPVTYPWWENIARVTEYRCASLLSLEIVLLSCAALVILTWIGIVWMPAGRALARGAKAAKEWTEETYNRLTRPKKYRE